VTSAFVLLLLATAWAVLPAFTDLRLGFPRSWITVGLAGLAWLLTLFAWIESFDGEFSVWALLGFLTATAILAFAVLSLVPELRNRTTPPSGPADAAPWATQPSHSGGQQAQHQPGPQHQPFGAGGHGQSGQPQDRPQQPYPARPADAPAPPPTGGSTASGEGSGTPGSGGPTAS
jgi:hypothetical protein